MRIKIIAAMALCFLATLTRVSGQNNTFNLSATLSSSSGLGNPAQVIAADLNGNGKVDLIGGGLVLTNNGKGVFSSSLMYGPTIHSNAFVVADVNHDGRLDVVMLTNPPSGSPYTDGIGVYTNSPPANNNNYTFTLGFYAGTSSVGYENTAGSGGLGNAGDVYGNGLVNLYYYNANSNSVCLFTNNGSGAFGSNTTFSLKMGLPTAVDVNRDGHVDFISPWASNNLVYVFTNNGSGTFGSNASLSVASPVKVFTADVNGDGWVDLLIESVTNFNASQIVSTFSVWTNNGSGVFGSNVSFTVGAVGQQAMDLKATNLFGDANLHLVFAVNDVNHHAGYLMVYTNNGSGGFGSNATLSAGANLATTSVAVGDFNGDGALDLASANYGNGSGTITVFTNTGSGIQCGSFLSNSIPVAGTNTAWLLAADLYRTGQPQLIVNNGYKMLEILTNNGSGMFGSNAMISGFTANTPGYYIEATPVAADIFGNGTPALMVSGSNPFGQYEGWMTVLTNNGAGVFGTNTTYNFGNNIGIIDRMVAADVNGDGHVDLVVMGNSSGENGLLILTNNGSGGFATNTLIQISSSTPAVMTLADVNNDGRPDLVVAYGEGSSGYSQLTIFTNLSVKGTGPLYASSDSQTYQVTRGANPSAVVAADVLGNGRMDIVIANFNAAGTLSIMTNSGISPYNPDYNRYSFGLSFSPSVGAYPVALTATDVNSDGKVDLISANWGLPIPTNNITGPLSYGTLTVLTNNGSGGFTNTATFSTGKGPTAVIALDVNGDGKPDLIAANYTSFTNNQNAYPYYSGTGNTLSILLNTSNFVNTLALQTAPTGASTITYGQALIKSTLSGVVSATNEAGVAVTGTISFAATNTVPPAGTNNCLAVFTPAPPTDYQPVTCNVSVTVNQLAAILSGTRAYDGTTNVNFNHLSVANRVGSDSVNVNGGSVGMATANIGANPITSTNGLTLGGSAATNYTLSGVSGSVNITTEANVPVLVSSQNPSAYGASVAFTATLPAYAGGTVQFLTNGFLFDTETLVSGSAGSVATTLMPPGSSTIAAVYSGDANDQATTGYLGQTVMLPQFNLAGFGTGGFAMSGSWGVTNATYCILASTNISLPTSQWTPVYTNQFDSNGNFNYTNAVVPGTPYTYFMLQLP